MNNASIVMLAGRSESTSVVYSALNKELNVDAVIIENSTPRAEFLRRRIESIGLFKVIGQICFKLIAVRFLQYISRARIEEIKRSFQLDDSPVPPTKLFCVDSVNSEDTRTLLKQLDPRVVVVNGTRIISDGTLRCIPAIFINMHAGITPLYRGVHGGYWALAREDPCNCGVSVHLVDEGIDTGPVLAQSLIKPTDADNFVTYGFLQLGAGIPLLMNAVRQALNGQVTTIKPPEGPSRFWSHPTLCSYIKDFVVHKVK